MKKILFAILINIVLCSVSAFGAESLNMPSKLALASAHNTVGTDFWLCFETNYKEDNLRSKDGDGGLFLELFISGDEETTVRIEIAGLDYVQEFSVPAGSVKNIKLPSSAQIRSSEVAERLAVHVTSEKPITVYGLNRRVLTTDTFIAIPTKELGTDYRVMCYHISDGLTSQFAIVATEDSTVVYITPKVKTRAHMVGKTFMIKLNRGDVYQVIAENDFMSKCDLTGTRIRSNKNIAVFSGHQCAYVTSFPQISACNHLVEQMPPTTAWGKHFYIGKLKDRSYYTYRVLANERNTKIFEDAKYLRALDSGEYYEGRSKSNLQITADKPILVAQYSQGYLNGDSIGDPMMILVSPTQQFLMKYRFATPIKGYWKHYINVVVPREGIASLRMDGEPVSPERFEQLGLSRYRIAYIEIPYGSHTITGSMPFGLYSYGFGTRNGEDAYDAYGTMGGQSFSDYEPNRDSLPPLSELNIDKKITLAVVRDDREDDSGLRTLRIIENEGMDATLPKIEPGAPQAGFLVRPMKQDEPARLIVEATDVAGNISNFTICWNYDYQNERYRLTMTEGIDHSCGPDFGYLLGAFASFTSAWHNASFSHSGNYSAKGNFSSAFGYGGFGGVLFGKQLTKDIVLLGTLAFNSLGGVISAPDSVSSFVRDENGDLRVFQESRNLSFSGVMLNAGARAEYHFKSPLYTFGGLSFSFPLTKSIDPKVQISQPTDYTYKNGSQEMNDPTAPASLSSIRALRVGADIGLGTVIPLNKRFSAYAELGYSHYFSSFLDDADWHINHLSINIGFRYRIFFK